MLWLDPAVIFYSEDIFCDTDRGHLDIGLFSMHASISAEVKCIYNATPATKQIDQDQLMQHISLWRMRSVAKAMCRFLVFTIVHYSIVIVYRDDSVDRPPNIILGIIIESSS